jgi:hypothetical protein
MLLVELAGVIVALTCMVVALWPGPWTMDIRGERGHDDTIQGIKEAIEILQRELDHLEAPEEEARIERLASTISTIAERGAALPSVQVVPPGG